MNVSRTTRCCLDRVWSTQLLFPKAISQLYFEDTWCCPFSAWYVKSYPKKSDSYFHSVFLVPIFDLSFLAIRF